MTNEDMKTAHGMTEPPEDEQTGRLKGEANSFAYTDSGTQRDPREASAEEFTVGRAKSEAENGRAITVVYMELDHEDGHVSNVVYGDLTAAAKMSKHLAGDLAMRVITQIAAEMGYPIDDGRKV